MEDLEAKEAGVEGGKESTPLPLGPSNPPSVNGDT